MKEKVLKMTIPFIVNEGQIANSGVRCYADTFGGTAHKTKSSKIMYTPHRGEK